MCFLEEGKYCFTVRLVAWNIFLCIMSSRNIYRNTLRKVVSIVRLLTMRLKVDIERKQLMHDSPVGDLRAQFMNQLTTSC